MRKGIIKAALGTAFMFVLSSCSLFGSGTKETECQSHDWFLESTTAATCVADGVKLYSCTKCGATNNEKIIHDGTEHKVVSSTKFDEQNKTAMEKAACGTRYSIYGECAYCHEMMEYKTAIKDPHDFSDDSCYTIEYNQLNNPDGTANPNVHQYVAGYKCRICGEWESGKEVVEKQHEDAHPVADDNYALDNGLCQYYKKKCICGYEWTQSISHSWDNGKITIKPTCTTAGQKVYTCSNDGCVIHKRYETINPLGHTFESSQENLACISRVCTTCNEEVEPTVDHSFALDFDCVDRECSVCGLKIAHTKDHTHKDVSLKKACETITCEECGALVASSTSTHTFTSQYECLDRACSECGTIVPATKEHRLNADGTQCVDCKTSVKLKAPVVSFDQTTKKLISSVLPEYTKYYCNGVEISDDLSTSSTGEYKITAKNIDPNGKIQDSDVSTEITVYVMNESPLQISTEYRPNFKEKVLVVSLATLEFDYPQGVMVELLDSDGNVVSTKHITDLQNVIRCNYSNGGVNTVAYAARITYEIPNGVKNVYVSDVFTETIYI